MDEYLTKPISPKELHRCLKQWMPGSKSALKPTPTDAPGRPTDEPRPHDVVQGGDGPVDINVLRKLVGDDDAIVHELLLDFGASTRKQGEALSQAWAASDHEQIARLAHQLKSSARSVGAHRLGHLCEEAERCAKANNPDMASMPELMHELQQVQSHLNNLIGEATS